MITESFAAQINGHSYRLRRDRGTLSFWVMTRLHQEPDELLDERTIAPPKSAQRSRAAMIEWIAEDMDARAELRTMREREERIWA